MRLLAALLGLTLAGCGSLASLAHTLNERQIQSCLTYSGFVGGGLSTSGQLQIRGVTATGGADLAQCLEQEPAP